MEQATTSAPGTTAGTPPHLIVDGLSMPAPERRWFEEWRAGERHPKGSIATPVQLTPGELWFGAPFAGCPLRAVSQLPCV